ncbi:ComF family protein [Streptomyces sp. HB132]|uniref:ComF family protein n=1 Tax=Streptomyces sp. HB132 TaxID=767388 RepID=UPI001961DCFA|nr:phosphoribosyltransferase family protein [Streptomyces sp. HB132]MBM7442849.1 putative amidophosphoribosyltransferase [Streptomyces sp. HB132]
MRGWWREIVGLVLPVACGGCGRPRTELCLECAVGLASGPRRVRPAPEPDGLPVVHAAAPYENAVRAMLLAHKERGALGLAGVLGCALAAAVRAGAGHGGEAGPLLLVPVPSARRATAGRGHDPVRRIAAAAAAELRRGGARAGLLAVLRQRRAVADQAGLGARDRQTNMAGALVVAAGGRKLLDGGRVVLVDDLLTTGATLAEAARAVRAARPPGMGAAEGLRAAVVAASPSAFEINRN